MNIFGNLRPRRWKPEKASNLNRLVPKRCRLDFEAARQPVIDETYEAHFNAILTDTRHLMEEVFGDVDFYRGSSPWVTEFSDEFYRYVEAVAQQDPRAGHWDRLLRFANERVFLLSAIFIKILDEEVFSSLLFGSRADHQKSLDAADISLIDLDGYYRSSYRARTNKVYLAASGYPPPLFWEKVDRIAAKTVVLFLPLYNIIGEFYEGDILSMAELFQRLHDIIAKAGLLNIMIRLSPSVTLIDWAKPGEVFESCHVSLNSKVLAHSKRQAAKFDRLNKKPREDRVARVKISIMPRIMRYTPARQLHQVGTLRYHVTEAHVVYYHGLRTNMADEALFITLKEHIKLVRTPGRQIPHLVSLAIMFFFGYWAFKLYKDMEIV